MTERSKVWRFLFPILFSAIWAFLFWKTRFGIANIDEAFYLTIPYRFCQGDLPLLHEWHLSQTSGLILTPLMKLYLYLFAGTEGILLRFRWIFTLFWGLGAIFFYRRLRKYSDLGAMTAALVFLIYTPMGIMALSYNTLGILLLTGACVILATAERKVRLQQFFAGVLFAGAVLCCPYLLAAYLLISMTVLLFFLIRREKGILSLWCFFSLGAAAVCAATLVVLLSAAPLRRYLEVFPYMLEDPEHEQVSLWAKTKLYLYFTATSSPMLLPAMAILLATVMFVRKGKDAGTGFAIAAVTVSCLVAGYCIRDRFINHLMFPVSLLGLFCGCTSRDRLIQRLLCFIWIPGLIYSFCLNLSSNQLFYAVSSASVLMTFAGLIMSARYISLLKNRDALNTNLSSAAFILLLVVLISSELFLRYDNIYWDDGGIQAQTAVAKAGSEAGIVMNVTSLKEYERANEDFLLLNELEDESVLFLSEKTWSYLGTDKNNASYSAWISGLNENTMPRLRKYYQLFPEKIPDLILIGPYYPNLRDEVESIGYEELEGETAYYSFYRKTDRVTW